MATSMSKISTMHISGIELLGQLLSFIGIPIFFMCRAMQDSCQREIDDALLDKPTWHIAEIIPGKGIWVHRREAFLYYLRTRRFRRAIRKRVAFSLSLRQRRARRLQAFMRRFLNREAGAK